MRTPLKQPVLLCFLLWTAGASFAFEGNDDNVTRDYYVQLYKTQDYAPDFKAAFAAESDRMDYKKLREYLNVKEEIMRVLKMAGDEYYYGLSYSNLYAADYVQSLEDEVNARSANEKVLLRLNSVRPNFTYNGEFTAGHIKTVILPAIRERYREAAKRDSINQQFYEQIQRNLTPIQQDIFQAEQAIYAALSPEFRDQDFRVWMSLTFSGLIAVILFAFFFIIYRRSDARLYRQMLSSAGLQFITVFVLIIAIILFGMLRVLGGSELAAILSGISGYILGKGGGDLADKLAADKGSENEAPPPEAERQEAERQEAERQEAERQEAEKFFPGEYES
ncbi:MAG: hypothetical protein LBF67_04145 [Prevotellaceae bacterium]|nr:hypothetical protein [Prevotellaceae bacterium]